MRKQIVPIMLGKLLNNIVLLLFKGSFLKGSLHPVRLCLRKSLLQNENCHHLLTINVLT